MRNKYKEKMNIRLAEAANPDCYCIKKEKICLLEQNTAQRKDWVRQNWKSHYTVKDRRK